MKRCVFGERDTCRTVRYLIYGPRLYANNWQYPASISSNASHVVMLNEVIWSLWYISPEKAGIFSLQVSNLSWMVSFTLQQVLVLLWFRTPFDKISFSEFQRESISWFVAWLNSPPLFETKPFLEYRNFEAVAVRRLQLRHRVAC